ncbi:MAG: FAD-dependent oxidoreductase [Deltaproteobacteria bacterium]|nr:FAD-dependent oxidoreductase [Deltaproteobacteria bacterium]
MPTYDFDIGIIGGGAAGLTVAAGAAQLGARTLLIEKEKELGGDCLHYGCVPSKTLIRTAQVYHLMKTATEFGLPGVTVPSVEFSAIAKRIQSVIQAIQEHDSEERFCTLGAKVLFGTPAFSDDHSVKMDGQVYAARRWVIATGSSPAAPPFEGLSQVPYLTNKDIFFLKRLPQSMIILGAGPIATEMAQAFCRLGTEVHVVQRSGQILSKEDKDMADLVLEALRSEGVQFYLNSTVQHISSRGEDSQEVVIRQGEREPVSLKAEKILVAVGRSANLGGLGLDRIGVAFDRKGVTVDDRMRTTQKHIYAAGDVTGAFQFTHAAGYEGGIVVSNAVFHLPRKVNYRWLPWCTYSDPELASIGMNEKRAKEAGIAYAVFSEAFTGNDRSLAEGERVGKIKMLLDEKENPIGVQILGPHAGELLNEWVAALNGKVKLSALASAVHPYPTLGEINKKVVGAFFSPKIFSDKVKKGLKLFFQLKGRACEYEAEGEKQKA